MRSCSSVAEADAGPEAAGEELPPPTVSSAPAVAQVWPATTPQAARLNATAESSPAAPLVQDTTPDALAGRGPAHVLKGTPEVDPQQGGTQAAVGSDAGAVVLPAAEQEHSLNVTALSSPVGTTAAVAVAEQVQDLGGSTLSSPAGLDAAAAVAEQLDSLVTAVTAGVASSEQEPLQAALPAGEQATGCVVTVKAAAALSSNEPAGQAGSLPSPAPMEVEQAVGGEAGCAVEAPAAVVSEQRPGPGCCHAVGGQEPTAEVEAEQVQPCRAAASDEQPAQEAEQQDADEIDQAEKQEQFAQGEQQQQAVESEEQPAQEEEQQQHGADKAELGPHDQEEQRVQEVPPEEFCQMCGRLAGLCPSEICCVPCDVFEQKPEGIDQTVPP